MLKTDTIPFTKALVVAADVDRRRREMKRGHLR